MSAYEQRIEPPDKKWQYLLFAAEPYETIAFKVPSREIDKSDEKFWTHWNAEAKQFFLQLSFKSESKIGFEATGQQAPMLVSNSSIQANQPLNTFVQIRQPTHLIPQMQPPMVLHFVP
jgi:hypothetical protein